MNKEKIEKLREETRSKLQEKFGNIIFDEKPHKYYVEGVEYTPVSNIISQYENKFDEENISRSYAEKNGLTQEEVLKSWKWTNRCSTIMGTRSHEFGESYTNFLCGHPELICEQNKPQYLKKEGWLVPTFVQEFAVKDFYDKLNKDLHPIGAEFKLSTQYIKGAKPICGTADLLFYYDAPKEENSGFVIGDWKGLDINTPIFTIKGWETMGTIKVGDTVYDKDGKQCKVRHTSQVHHRKCYKISFDNGDSIISDNEHRWLISLGGFGKEAEDKVMTSEEIYEYIHQFYNNDEYQKLDINDILRIKCCKHIENGESFEHLPSFDWENVGGWIWEENISSLMDEFPIGNTNITEQILLEPYENRLAILVGYIKASNGYKYDKEVLNITIKKEFQYKILSQLISSLGIKFFVTYNENEEPTSIYTDLTYSYRTITNIVEVESVPTRCIEVDSPTHTFLCGKNFLVTHNTNKELTKDYVRNVGQMMLPPFENYYDEALSHYYLQFNLYQRMMESVGLKIIARRLIHLKRDGTYEVHTVPKIDDYLIDQVIMK